MTNIEDMQSKIKTLEDYAQLISVWKTQAGIGVYFGVSAKVVGRWYLKLQSKERVEKRLRG